MVQSSSENDSPPAWRCAVALTSVWETLLRKILATVALAFVATGLVACGDKGVEVSASSYGSDWPFPPFDKAILSCKNTLVGSGSVSISRPFAMIELGGKVYGLNGAALGVGGYPDPKEFTPRDPYTTAYAGKTAAVTAELLDMALNLCK